MRAKTVSVSKSSLITRIERLIFLAMIMAFVFGLVACGDKPLGTAGQDSVEDESNVYSGAEIPSGDEVSSFLINFWAPLREAGECENCHDTGQDPNFVNSADINAAYSAAVTVVDVLNPGNSAIVAKVGQGHNCWLPNNNQACADIVQQMIVRWLGVSSSLGTEIALVAPSEVDPADSKNFPALATDNNPNSFELLIHTPYLEAHCAGCHASNSSAKQAPFFADSDVEAAYQAAKAKINLTDPASSRFVLRLREESHNCWSTCSDDADDMEQAISDFAAAIATTEVDSELVTSKAMTFGLAIVASGGKRYDTDMIARWEFKEGTGTAAADTSSVLPAMDLALSGSYQWVSGYGVEFSGGKAQAETADSDKLRSRILQTGQYSIEAWVVPANVVQDNVSIVTYSNGAATRNFTMGQSMYNYDFLNHGTRTDGTDDSRLSTNDDDEDLQATLQHVVMTFDAVNGRQIYVNGASTGDADEADEQGGILDWSAGLPLILGSEQGGGNTAWHGKIRMLVIHNRVLNATQIRQNFDAGVGEKYFMLFSLSDHLGLGWEGSYVLLEAQQYDNYAYLFNKPKFINLNPGWTPPASLPIEGIRIGVNGRETVSGQGFGNVSVAVNAADYVVGAGQLLSGLGTVITTEQGIEVDQFFLTFEKLGDAENAYVEADPQVPVAAPDADAVSDIGVRTFDEINHTLSTITGIPVTNTAVSTTFDSYRRQLPAVEDVQAYLSSHQMAIAQLAMTYCDQLVSSNQGFFPSFNFGALPSTAFSNPDTVLNPLLTAAMNIKTSTPSDNLATQPDVNEVKAALSSNASLDLIENFEPATPSDDDYSSLIDCMTRCERSSSNTECEAYINSGESASCSDDAVNNSAARTRQVVTATCAAVLGSAVMLIQ